VGVCRGCPNFWVPPIISGTGKATDFKFGETFTWPIRIKAHKNLGKRERGRIYGLPNFLGVPPIISGTGKATDFKFCRNIHRVDRNKSPLKILGIVAVGVVREPRKFSGHPRIGRTAQSLR